MMTRRWTRILALACLCALGCEGEFDRGEGADEAPSRAWEDNGFRLNGFRLNGFRLNGFRLNGEALAGEGDEHVRLTAVVLSDGVSLSSRWIYEGELKGYAYPTVRSGSDLIGARLYFEVVEGGVDRTRTVKVADVTPPGPTTSVWLYDLDVRDEDGAYEPLCTDGEGARTQAIVIEDLWDADSGDRVRPLPSGAVTFACLGAALAKCVQWGHVPWESVDGVNLADHHQACTRAVRADYCGDGTPHTTDGTEIHILDLLGIETPAEGEIATEAEWGPDGATCVDLDHLRHPEFTVECDAPACGEPFADGALIQTGIAIEG
ncbi:MAG: ADYC domain-containing protein [Nannocystaceae bacterium]